MISAACHRVACICALMDLRLLAWAPMSAIAFTTAATAANASCFADAAARYGVSETVLRAIATVESGSAPATVESRNTNGTRDIGRMQINTWWLPELKKFGITEAALRDECTSIHVGAWILANNVSQHGEGWDAIGAYNVGCRSLSKDECTRRRNRYAWKVFNALKPNQREERAFMAAAEPVLGSVEFSQ